MMKQSYKAQISNNYTMDLPVRVESLSHVHIAIVSWIMDAYSQGKYYTLMDLPVHGE